MLLSAAPVEFKDTSVTSSSLEFSWSSSLANEEFCGELVFIFCIGDLIDKRVPHNFIGRLGNCVLGGTK